MENEIFFCKSSVGKSFVRTSKNPVESNIIYQNKDGKFFCIQHRKWEDGKISNLDIFTNEITLETECENKIRGFFTNSNLFSYRVKINNNEFCPLLIEENYIDTETLEKYKLGKIFLKKIPLKSQQICYGKASIDYFFSYYRRNLSTSKSENLKSQNSDIVKNYAEKLLWRYQKNRNQLLTEKPALPNIYEFDQDERLELLATFPCEPGIVALKNIFPIKKIRSDDKNAYFTLCKIAEIKTWPFLRKKFLENPYNLVSAKNIIYFGFKDKNVINDILESKYCKNFFSGEQLAQNEWDHESLRFFFEKALEKRSERAVWNTIVKNLKSYIPLEVLQNLENSENFGKKESNLAIYSGGFKDAAKMFMDYFDYLPEEIVYSVIYDGLSRYNHDVLSKYNPNLKNIEFKYSKRQLELEDNILGFDFYLPKESFDLVNLGSTLHNCVGSYSNNVMKNFCTIVAVKKDDFPVLCIEVRDLKTVHQVRADHNLNPSGKLLEVFELWQKKHYLVFSGNHW